MLGQDSEITMADAHACHSAAQLTSVDYAKADKVDLAFENTEVVSLDPKAIKTLQVLRPITGKTRKSYFFVQGFYLEIVNAESSIKDVGIYLDRYDQDPGLSRIRDYADIVAIELYRGKQKTVYTIDWSADSAPTEENVVQHYAQADQSLVVLALNPETYSLAALAYVAKREERWDDIIGVLHDGLKDMSKFEVAQLVETVSTELLNASESAPKRTDRHIVVHYDASEHDPWLRWHAVMHDDRDNKDYGCLGLMSYPELVGMDVRVEAQPFYAGFAWLLYEIAWHGSEAISRQQHIDAYLAKLKR